MRLVDSHAGGRGEHVEELTEAGRVLRDELRQLGVIL